MFFHGEVWGGAVRSDWRAFLLAAFLVAARLGGQSASAADSSATAGADWFCSEYRPAVARLRERYANLRCKMTVDARWDTSPIREHFFVKGDARGEVRDYTSDAPRGGVYGKVHVYKPDGLFYLERHESSGPWVLRLYEYTPTQESIAHLIRPNVDKFAHSPFTIGGIDLGALLCSPGVSIERVATTEDDRTGLSDDVVTLSFVRVDPLHKLASGRFTFDRAHDWVLRSYRDCRFLADSEGVYVLSSGTLDYKVWEPSGLLFPSHITHTEFWSTDGETHKIYEARVTEARSNDVHDAEFDLDTYGVAPIAPPQDRSRYYAALVAAFFLILGAVFLVQARRRRVRQPSPGD